MGDAACNNVSLSFVTPAVRIHIRASLTLKTVCDMAAPLLQRTKEEPRAVFRFLWSERVKKVEIDRRMLFQYADSCLAQRKVYE